ncbi:uncharacterized protein LOC131954690 [Physella acuta]|uniref:uncharacterized protein LOC131954690 n=1 Tax=Physella acuta TaxID=109671 RepID=UPI0027DDCB46|nr:uncharacterized protein LOC131954690 [Physella acuta]
MVERSSTYLKVSSVQPSPPEEPGQDVANYSGTCWKWEETARSSDENFPSMLDETFLARPKLTGRLMVAMNVCLFYDATDLKFLSCDLVKVNISRLRESYMDMYDYEDAAFNAPMTFHAMDDSEPTHGQKELTITASYCFTSKSPDVQAYICNRGNYNIVYGKGTVTFKASVNTNVEGDLEDFSITRHLDDSRVTEVTWKAKKPAANVNQKASLFLLALLVTVGIAWIIFTR